MCIYNLCHRGRAMLVAVSADSRLMAASIGHSRIMKRQSALGGGGSITVASGVVPKINTYLYRVFFVFFNFIFLLTRHLK